MLIAMSLIKVNNINKIWNSNPFFSLPMSNLLARDRFKAIDKFFHLVDNS